MLRSARPVLLLLLLLAPALAKEKGEVFHPRRAEVAPFPREIALGKQLELKVKPARNHKTPVVTLTAPDGSTKYFHPLRRLADGFEVFKVGFEKGKGAYRFEVVVDSDRGDTTAAQFTVWVGVKKPDGGEETLERRTDASYPPEPEDVHLYVLERKMFRLINAYRKQQGLAPYPWLEKVAVLGRAHLTDYLKMRPRPKELTHLIPSYGAIADRFEDLLAADTARKFPIRDPDIGPEAMNYITESLAAMRSVDWLFTEYYLRESAFRKPVISKFPTHAAVAMVRDKKTDHLFSATIYVQVNSTRVRKTLEAEKKELTKLESRTRVPGARAVFLRKLGRQGDPRSLPLFRRRLGRGNPPEVRAGALDAITLNAPDEFVNWRKKQELVLEKGRRTEDYADSLPTLLALSHLQWSPAIQNRALRELRFVERLVGFELEAAEATLAKGEREKAIEHFREIAKRFRGLPAAKTALDRVKELE